MTTKIFYGDLEPKDLAQELYAYFDRGNFQVQQFGDASRLAVQVGTRKDQRSGGQTALTVSMQKVPDGVSIQVSNQLWLGIAASIGMTALSALRNPLSLLGRIDDIAQDLESSQLEETVWQVLEKSAKQRTVSRLIAERLDRTVCLYCHTPNEVKSNRCFACGAPLGEALPVTCTNCGFVVKAGESNCPNCRKPIVR